MNYLRSLIRRLENLKSLKEKLIFHLLISLGAFILVFSRRPDAVLNPQFWAEDGRTWYAEAYNNGALVSLFKSEAGYFQTASRLTAIFAQILPLSVSPLFFNLFAITIKISVVNYLLSGRFSELIPSLLFRFLLAFIYLGLPHSFEVHANLTNVQWHLALLSFLIIIAKSDNRLGWEIFDYLILLISAFSGPFCVLLLPIAIIFWWQKRQKQKLIILSILGLGAFIQISALLTNERLSNVELGASIENFLRIIGSQIFLASILGQRITARIVASGIWGNFFVVLLINLWCFALIGWTLLKAHLELKLFVLFSSLLLAGALFSPVISDSQPQWEMMKLVFTGIRYWFIPSVCFLTLLSYLVITAKQKFIRFIALIPLMFFPIGCYFDWVYPPFKDLNFPQYAQEFEAATPGTKLEIPINPDWKMTLIKK